MALALAWGSAWAGHVPLEQQPLELRPLAAAVMARSVPLSACFQSAERAGVSARGRVDWLAELDQGRLGFRRASSDQVDNARLLGCLDGALSEADFGTISGVYVIPIDFDAGLFGVGELRSAGSDDLELALSRGVGDCVASARRRGDALEGELSVGVALAQGRSEVAQVSGGSAALKTCVRAVLSGVPVPEGTDRRLDYRIPLGPSEGADALPGSRPARLAIQE